MRAREGSSELTRCSLPAKAAPGSSGFPPPRRGLSARRGAHVIPQAERLSYTPIFHPSLPQILKRVVEMQGVPQAPSCSP